MIGFSFHITAPFADQYIVLDMEDSYTCSFEEFYPFCRKLYYFSNFKDFSTSTPA